MYVGESLSQVAAHTVLAVLECVDWEETYVFQVNRVCTCEIDAEVCLVEGAWRLYHHLILLPVSRLHLEFVLRKLLFLLHGVLVDELHTDCRCTLWGSCPNGEAIFLALHNSDAEVTLVLESSAALLVSWVAKGHIVWTTLERSVVLQLYLAEDLPTHEVLRELKRSVFYQLTIQTTIGSIVDVLKEESIHGVLNRGSHLFGVDVHDICLGTCRHR